MVDPVETPIGQVTVHHFMPTGITHQAMVGPKFLHSLFNPRDKLHVVSRACMAFIRSGELPYRRLVVNDHIVDETATRLKRRASIRHAMDFLETTDKSNVYQFEHVSETVFHDAKERFTDWTDSEASLTDFIVAAHMNVLGVDHLFTYDRHYDTFNIITLPYHDF